jgi:hypothetical protein
VAASAGVPVASVHRTHNGYASLAAPHRTQVVVVGNRCLHASSAALAERALRVARTANVSLLNTYFSGSADDPVFLGADVWVDLYEPRVSEAVLALLAKGEEPRAEVVS